MKLKFVKRAIAVAVLGLGVANVALALPEGNPDTLVNGSTLFSKYTALGGAGPGIYEQVDAVNNPVGLGGTVPGGLLLLASQSAAFSAPGYYTGTLYSAVYSGDANNPLGGLDFVYQITVNPGSGISDGVHRMTVNGFGGWLTDVGMIRTPTDPTIAGERDPTSVDRSGGTVGWNFLPSPQCGPSGCFGTPGVLIQGKTSALMIVYTNAPVFGKDVAGILDGQPSSASVYAPIPEPETYAMMLAGLGLMGFVARRRKGMKNVA